MQEKIKIYNQKAESVGEIELPRRIFDVKLNPPLVHQALVTQIANMRQVLAHTKGRGEVRGGGKKPWRQKGTGRARVGSTRSPLWIGGGVTFGPLKTRNFKRKINKKMNQKALLMVLSDRTRDNKLSLLDGFEANDYKTKTVDNMLSDFEKKIFNIQPMATKTAKNKEAKESKRARTEKRSILVIYDQKDQGIKRSGRNIKGAKFINIDNFNIFDLLKYRYLILTKNCVSILIERYSANK
jgi:large subunit ribosomal protein L4